VIQFRTKAMPRPNVSDERVPQILNAAMKVFNRKGLADARMEDIAKEAELSVGGVYWYYKSKDEVVFAILDQVIDEDVSMLKSLLQATGTVRERFIGYIESVAEGSLTYIPLTYELYNLSQRNMKVRKHIQKYLSQYRDVLAQLIQQGVMRGEISGQPESIAITLAAMYEGHLELAMLDHQKINLVKALTESIHMLFDGIKNKEER
jgi:AcrR family transcriptional regulator